MCGPTGSWCGRSSAVGTRPTPAWATRGLARTLTRATGCRRRTTRRRKCTAWCSSAGRTSPRIGPTLTRSTPWWTRSCCAKKTSEGLPAEVARNKNSVFRAAAEDDRGASGLAADTDDGGPKERLLRRPAAPVPRTCAPRWHCLPVKLEPPEVRPPKICFRRGFVRWKLTVLLFLVAFRN